MKAGRSFWVMIKVQVLQTLGKAGKTWQSALALSINLLSSLRWTAFFIQIGLNNALDLQTGFVLNPS